MSDSDLYADDTYLEVDADGSGGTPDAMAEILRSVAQTIEKSPDDRRYDFELVIDERSVNADTQQPEEEQ